MDNVLTLFDLIGELARRRYQAAERCFAPLGLNHTEARLLTLLDRGGGTATQEELSRLIFIDRSNAGRALKRLAHQGFVDQQKDDTDKRANLLQITDKGRTIVAEIATVRVELAHALFGALQDDEAASLVELLTKAIGKNHDV